MLRIHYDKLFLLALAATVIAFKLSDVKRTGTIRPLAWSLTTNLSAHKVDGVRERIETCGATLLYLPPYAPNFNPIEKA